MTLSQGFKPRSTPRPSANSLAAWTALFLIVCQAGISYYYFQKISEENAALRAQLAALRLELPSVSIEGRRAVRTEVETQLTTFVDRAEERLRTTTLDLIRAKRLIIVDRQGSERIALGTGLSEFSGMPNTSIKLTSPSAKHPIVLSTADDVASVTVSKRLALIANNGGQGGLSLYRDAYVTGARPIVFIGADTKARVAGILLASATGIPQVDLGTTPELTRLMLFDKAGRPAVLSASTPGVSVHAVLAGENRFRAAFGLNSDALAFSELYNEGGELVYAVQSGADPYARSFIRADPASTVWNAASTFSTLKTFWDIFRR